jgi:hypothetical protein
MPPDPGHVVDGALRFGPAQRVVGVRKYGAPSGIASLDDLEQRFAYRDFAHFMSVEEAGER